MSIVNDASWAPEVRNPENTTHPAAKPQDYHVVNNLMSGNEARDFTPPVADALGEQAGGEEPVGAAAQGEQAQAEEPQRAQRTQRVPRASRGESD